MNHLMLDFESLGTHPNSIILSLGACFFDIDRQVLGNTFYEIFDIDDQVKKGRTITGDTIKWWLKQDIKVKDIFEKETLPLNTALMNFITWIIKNTIDNSKLKVWGNGFDVPMAENALQQTNNPILWKYSNVRCYKTFRRYVANNAPCQNIGVAHNALDDAITQANYVMKYGKGK